MFLPRKDDETYLFFNRYEESKGLAIIQDFAAHCAMKNEQIAQVWKYFLIEGFPYRIILHNIKMIY